MSRDPLTVCYNGECGICRIEIDSYRRSATADGIDIHWCNIANEPAVLADLGITENDIARRLHVVVDGKLLVGIEAFAALWARLPRLAWLAALVERPMIRPIAHLIYEGLMAPPLYALHLRRRRRRVAR